MEGQTGLLRVILMRRVSCPELEKHESQHGLVLVANVSRVSKTRVAAVNIIRGSVFLAHILSRTLAPSHPAPRAAANVSRTEGPSAMPAIKPVPDPSVSPVQTLFDDVSCRFCNSCPGAAAAALGVCARVSRYASRPCSNAHEPGAAGAGNAFFRRVRSRPHLRKKIVSKGGRFFQLCTRWGFLPRTAPPAHRRRGVARRAFSDRFAPPACRGGLAFTSALRLTSLPVCARPPCSHTYTHALHALHALAFQFERLRLNCGPNNERTDALERKSQR